MKFNAEEFNASIPAPVLEALSRLEDAGHESWLVGGCVRDAFLGQPRADWDICTAALPEETEQVFAGSRLIETGLRHGTVTLLLGGETMEITTYRADGTYSDSRHPDEVRFVRTLEEDLSRRDFTCNAMAYHPARGLADPFGGAADIEQGVIRCVGEPAERFSEDALRILRCIRFASRLGFTVDPATADAVHAGRESIRQVSAERCFSELKGILCGRHAQKLLAEFSDVLFVLLPELQPLLNYDQQLVWQVHDAWTHTLLVLSAAPRDPVIRLAALFHDCGKPETAAFRPDGQYRFPGHAARSAELADSALRRLRCDNVTREAVCDLTARHASPPARSMNEVMHELSELGEKRTRQLCALRRADAIGYDTAFGGEKLRLCDQERELIDEALSQGGCITLKTLAVRGEDLIALGMEPGPVLGRTLHELLDAVLNGKAPNEREALLNWLSRENSDVGED